MRSPGPHSAAFGGSISSHGGSLSSIGSSPGSVFAPIPPPSSGGNVTTSVNVSLVVELNVDDPSTSFEKTGSLVFCTTSPFLLQN